MSDSMTAPAPGTIYKHSGRYDCAALVRLLLISIVALAVLMPAYTFVSMKIERLSEEPDGWQMTGYLQKCLVLGCAVGMGYVVRYGGLLSKVRSRDIIIGCGLLMGLASLYLIWVLWFALVGETLLLSPIDLVGAVLEGLDTREFNPGAVYFETFVLLFLPALIAAASFNVPYCERCGQWTVASDKVPIRPIDNAAEMQSQISRSDFSGLTALPMSDLKRSMAYLQCYECPHCRTFGTITISQVSPSQHFERHFRRIVANLIIDAAAYHRWKGDFPPRP